MVPNLNEQILGPHTNRRKKKFQNNVDHIDSSDYLLTYACNGKKTQGNKQETTQPSLESILTQNSAKIAYLFTTIRQQDLPKEQCEIKNNCLRSTMQRGINLSGTPT